MTHEMEMPADTYALRYTRMVSTRWVPPMAYWAIALLVFLGLLLSPYGGVQLNYPRSASCRAGGDHPPLSRSAGQLS